MPFLQPQKLQKWRRKGAYHTPSILGLEEILCVHPEQQIDTTHSPDLPNTLAQMPAIGCHSQKPQDTTRDRDYAAEARTVKACTRGSIAGDCP
ncbi:Hypothetical predicted protein, partial [Pelobates cultripes]